MADSPVAKKCKATKSHVSLVLGSQWGDEGKGKVVDVLATESDLVCRCQGGSNAGHTVVVNDVTYKFHLIPSGITSPEANIIIGNGVVLHIPTLMSELKNNEEKGIPNMKSRLVLSSRCHMVFDLHQHADGLMEQLRGKSSLGTTKRGIGPTYATKALRNGLRLADLVGDWARFEKNFKDLVFYQQKLFPEIAVDVDAELARYKGYAEELRPMVKDTVIMVNEYLNKGVKILVEGANASMLDIDFGTYPYVTSSNCGAGGVCTGLGMPPRAIDEIYGVVKAYTTRVGTGALPTELLDDIGEHMQEVGREFGTTTGRRRRCGWLDLVVVRYTHMINGYTGLAITKLDVLDDLKELKVAVKYKIDGEEVRSFPADINDLDRVEVDYVTLPGWQQSIKDVRKFSELPENAKAYLRVIEEYVGVPVKWVSVGPHRAAMINVF